MPEARPWCRPVRPARLVGGRSEIDDGLVDWSPSCGRLKAASTTTWTARPYASWTTQTEDGEPDPVIDSHQRRARPVVGSEIMPPFTSAQFFQVFEAYNAA